jgi:hypothetical protein
MKPLIFSMITHSRFTGQTSIFNFCRSRRAAAGGGKGGARRPGLC